ncbi:Nitrogenase (molybdenum-iron) reductase and maturation protein NifH [Methanosarcina barkeri str. Wiesmoor]|uniref:Nitrogenase (Molybdenum-iron) reductase and maturation protein NifH n=2 Tax=Methanosarcina barkeri TaxID=2208 RepID=A0A0E3LKT1_METBA|nr:Nitrogenase (molybdenum-iron) reductase and maturation protein NifH [Methanosarcina barkeri str. Wiesmoor]
MVIYKNGRIGKSTTTQNLTAFLETMGNKILLVGCGPKADSTRVILGGLSRKTVLDTLKSEGDEGFHFETVVQPGFGNIECVESGGPEPGVGCANQGIIASIGLLENDQFNDMVKNSVFFSSL